MCKMNNITVFTIIIYCLIVSLPLTVTHEKQHGIQSDNTESSEEQTREQGPSSGFSRRNYAVDEASMTVPQIIQKYNYPVEVYTVLTKDGYILTMHRIPWGFESGARRRSTTSPPKPVAFLMHGIFASSADFILNGPKQSLAYLLADAGYDVWMGNARGNRYSRNHQSMLPANNVFWDFSFHEIAIYDLPAMIDFITGMVPGLLNMFYIGHSQGTTIFYILLAELPQYNARFTSSFSLSPIAFMSHMTSPLLKFFAMFSNQIGLFFDVLGVGEFLPSSQLMSSIGHIICKGMDFTQFICTTPLFALAGYNPNNLDKAKFPLYMGHIPAGSSTRQVIHYGQLYQSGQFRPYDLGITENLLKYHTLLPPIYNMSRITAPIHVFYSSNDWLAHVTDVQHLLNVLPNAIKHHIPDPNFGHFDFMYGMNSKEMVYNPVLKIIREILRNNLYT